MEDIVCAIAVSILLAALAFKDHIVTQAEAAHEASTLPFDGAPYADADKPMIFRDRTIPTD